MFPNITNQHKYYTAQEFEYEFESGIIVYTFFLNNSGYSFYSCNWNNCKFKLPTMFILNLRFFVYGENLFRMDSLFHHSDWWNKNEIYFLDHQTKKTKYNKIKGVFVSDEYKQYKQGLQELFFVFEQP